MQGQIFASESQGGASITCQSRNLQMLNRWRSLFVLVGNIDADTMVRVQGCREHMLRGRTLVEGLIRRFLCHIIYDSFIVTSQAVE